MLMRVQRQVAFAAAGFENTAQVEKQAIKDLSQSKCREKHLLFPGLHFQVLFQHIKPNAEIKNSLMLK